MEKMKTVRIRTRLTALVLTMAVAAIVWGVLLDMSEANEADPGPLGIQIVGPQEILSESTVALQITVTNHLERKPASGALVTVRLSRKGTSESLLVLSRRTDGRGVLDASFELPDLESGDYDLVVRARHGNLRDEFIRTVAVKRAFQVLLTTDKPLYKPAQSIHMRALALRRPHMRAMSDAEVLFEVSDPRGNKVFKRTVQTSDFGVAAMEFTLGDEINLGRYTVRAFMGDEQVEKTVEVKRYVLPKFRVTVTPERAYYLPGEQVQGMVQADYFFGKPVDGGRVSLVVKTFDVAFKEVAVLTGNTDANGTWNFDIKLPAHFVGQPLEQGDAFLQFEAEVTDQAEHKEKAVVSSRVAAAPLSIHMIPEGGALVPGVENIVYIAVARPTGEPVSATVNWQAADAENKGFTSSSPAQVKTDDLGIAEIRLTPDMPAAEAVPTGQVRFAPRPFPGMIQAPVAGMPFAHRPDLSINLAVEAAAADGSRADAKKRIPVAAAKADEAILLRTDLALYAIGQSIEAVALTTATGGTIYFDVVKERQTLITAAAEVKDGRATVTIPLSTDMGGALRIAAYRIAPNGEMIRATRPVFVDPAQDLSVDVRPDQETYRPGPENVAKVHFSVTDQAGRPVAAAIGVNVVDESLFAIQEMQPGMEMVYFYLEKELATPRYEIHGFDLPTIIAGPPPPDGIVVPMFRDPFKQRAAQVMLASVEAPDTPLFTADTYRERLAEARPHWMEQLQPQVKAIGDAVVKWHDEERQPVLTEKTGLQPLIDARRLRAQQLNDLWGRPMRVLAHGEGLEYAFILWSLGPDGVPETVDDFYLSTAWPDQVTATLEEMLDLVQQMHFGLLDFAAEGAPMPLAAPVRRDAVAGAAAPAEAIAKGAQAPAPGEPVRIRQFFPETLLVEPQLITDDGGTAVLEVPMADSITSWRLVAIANSRLGGLGSAVENLRCFQDFFVDIDLPVSLTEGDQVSIPVAVYNYLPEAQTVKLQLTEDDWFELTGPWEHELVIGSNEVDVRYFTITAKKLGSKKLLVHGYGSRMSDAIERSITIEPDGKRFETTVSGRLDGDVSTTVTIPDGAVADASNILVKIYPGIFSQAVEGLDSILRMPFGCFEQTSSVTYPNVLVLDYMKNTGQVTPELQMKAEGFINNGYQRLLTFEVPGGGFSWFGNPPANRILTAYGVMQFYDMGRVYEVDPELLRRTRQWLLSQQEDDGSWKPDESYLHQESWSRIQNTSLPPTAYITWALAYSGGSDPGLTRAVEYLRRHADEAKDPYVLSILANALVNADLKLGDKTLDDSTIGVLDRLVAAAKREDGKMWWETEMTGFTHSSGQSADLEVTGMAALALIAADRTNEATEVLNYLIAAKDPSGTWYSTQATTLALRALMAAQSTQTRKVEGTVDVVCNGETVATLAITPEDADVLRQVDCRKVIRDGDNDITIRFTGEGSTLYQVVGIYYMPWDERPAPEGPLSINVDYNRTTLTRDDTITATVTVRNNTPLTTSMVIVDLGIPPGFAVESEDLDERVEDGVLDRYSLTGRQVICYLEKLDPRQSVTFRYRLRAKFPIRAQTPKSTVYEYYNPDNRADAPPVELQVN